MSEQKNNMESLGKAIGTIFGLTLMTVWVTIVATFTYNWYTGG